MTITLQLQPQPILNLEEIEKTDFKISNPYLRWGGSIFEFTDECNWDDDIVVEEWRKSDVDDYSLFDDVSNEFYMELRNRLNLNRNNYISVCGDLGTGKSTYAITLAYMLDPDFCYEKIVMDVDGFAYNLKEFRKDFTIVWDEADFSLSSQDWQKIKARPELRSVFTSQRAYRINIIFTSKTMAMLFNVVRYLTDYAIFLRYRCPYHSHGLLYKTACMVDEITSFLSGTTSLAWSEIESDPQLNKIVKKYFEEKKEQHMHDRQEDFINIIDFNYEKQERLLEEFLNLAKRKNIDIMARGSKGLFKAWLNEKALREKLPISKTMMDELYDRLKLRLMLE